MALREQLGEGDWGQVNSPGGAFLGYWWHFRTLGDFDAYLQLEQKALCWKIGPSNGGDDPTAAHRNAWHGHIMGFSEGKLRKPRRFGSGATMTVAVHKDEYRVVNSSGAVDLAATAAALKDAARRLDAAVIAWQTSSGSPPAG
jgi:hypothetical protein